MSLKTLFACAAAMVCGWSAAAAVVELKDQAAVTGKILAEKPDSIVVDVGYTALVIPRSQITRISETEATPPVKPADKVKSGAAGAATATAASKSDIYYLAPKNAVMRTVRELVNTLGESVVQVRTPGGMGSGFFLSEDGFLITNFHVIEGETQVSVEVYHQKGGELERKTYKQVRIIAINKFADLALLRIEDKDAPKFAHVALGDSDALAVGERVFAIGSPLGLERTVTEGILSSKTREFQGDLYLQTTAQINPGNSGGPLFNLAGDVIGVTNMKITFGEGLGFAIPMSAVRYFLDHRDAFAYANDNPSNPYRYLEPPSRMTRTNDDIIVP